MYFLFEQENKNLSELYIQIPLFFFLYVHGQSNPKFVNRWAETPKVFCFQIVSRNFIWQLSVKGTVGGLPAYQNF